MFRARYLLFANNLDAYSMETSCAVIYIAVEYRKSYGPKILPLRTRLACSNRKKLLLSENSYTGKEGSWYEMRFVGVAPVPRLQA